MDSLHCDANFSKDSHLLAGKAELCVLQVCHLHADITHQVVVNNSAGWGGKIWTDKASEGSSFDGKYKFLFLVGVIIAKGGGNFRNIVAAHHFKFRWFFSDEYFIKFFPLFCLL